MEMDNDPIDNPHAQGPRTGPATAPDYVSLREIGVGSYGRVWLVQDRTSGEYCAVKIIYRHLFEDDVPYKKERAGVQRFSELSTASRNLLKIIHVGLHDQEGYFYYLMELADHCQGGQGISPVNYAPRTLKWELERNGHRERLQAKDCLRIMLSLTAGLEELHNGGLIHRDIKPANIIFVGGEPKLADIGLVTSKELTRTIVSTPGYFREGEPQSERSDIYGLGKVLYEILTGLDRRDDVDFPRLPEGIKDWQDRQLVLRLNEVVSRACARSPRKRYQSAREMRADLESLNQGKSVGNGLKHALAPLRSLLSVVISVTLLLLLVLAGWKWDWKLRSARQDLAPFKRGLAGATNDDPWTNSLGMKFVAVPNTKVLFCVWDTRVQDFEAFVSATVYDATQGVRSQVNHAKKQQGDTWKSPGFSQGPTHPVCGVGWNDAEAFCQWLTQKERKAGLILEGQSYRLPTDAEWSIAVGLGQESGTTPKDKDRKNRDAFPWGTQWPPPRGMGNYHPSVRLDKYPKTSPVGSFEANRYGLYDMGGNVRNWCEDEYAPGGGNRVLRGASWSDYYMGSLLSSRRFVGAPDFRLVRNGFRCVLATTEVSPGGAANGMSK
jgi:serine/threonine protein kinase